MGGDSSPGRGSPGGLEWGWELGLGSRSGDRGGEGGSRASRLTWRAAAAPRPGGPEGPFLLCIFPAGCPGHPTPVPACSCLFAPHPVPPPAPLAAHAPFRAGRPSSALHDRRTVARPLLGVAGPLPSEPLRSSRARPRPRDLPGPRRRNYNARQAARDRACALRAKREASRARSRRRNYTSRQAARQCACALRAKRARGGAYAVRARARGRASQSAGKRQRP